MGTYPAPHVPAHVLKPYLYGGTLPIPLSQCIVTFTTVSERSDKQTALQWEIPAVPLCMGNLGQAA